MDIALELSKLERFEKVPPEQLEWLEKHAQTVKLAIGEKLFEVGDLIDKLQIIVSGSLRIKLKKNNQFITVANVNAPAITGLLPYSRATVAKGVGIVEDPVEVIQLKGEHFREMICDCHELTTVLVHEMSSRIRSFTKQEQLDDKMLSLGKLSAGLAHELNNPSAAVVRSSQELSKHLRFLPDKFKQVIKIKANEEDVDRINDLIFSKVDSGLTQLSLMEKSELEDELLDWLDDNAVENGDDIIDMLVEYEVSIEDLEAIKSSCRPEDLGPIIHWMNQVLTTEKLVGEIENASERINDLVTSIKSYTHMDQAPEKVKTNIHEAIDNTLTIMNHKLKANEIVVIREYEPELPLPKVLPSSINQVWTNLIDNAIDAMSGSDKRELVIRTYSKTNFVIVEIQDSGTGIDESIMDQIFDPFFTTKEIGKGTGLGLENVMQIIKIQHAGVIEVNSKEGETIFRITIPIESK